MYIPLNSNLFAFFDTVFTPRNQCAEVPFPAVLVYFVRPTDTSLVGDERSATSARPDPATHHPRRYHQTSTTRQAHALHRNASQLLAD
jgi:hypothetical protein